MADSAVPTHILECQFQRDLLSACAFIIIFIDVFLYVQHSDTYIKRARLSEFIPWQKSLFATADRCNK